MYKADCVKIGDLGASKQLSRENERAYSFVGTEGFKAPEIINAEEYNSMCDMYSLGCLLEMLRTKSRIDSIFLNIMIGLLMKRNPEERPTASQVM